MPQKRKKHPNASRVDFESGGKLRDTTAVAPARYEARYGGLHGDESLWSPLYGVALDSKSNEPQQRQLVPAKPILFQQQLSLTGSSCSSTDTAAWNGPSSFFAPPWPNTPSHPAPACPDRPLRRSQPAAPGCLVAAAGLEGRRGVPAQDLCRNAGVLPAECRGGNNPAPAARATDPSPSTCAAARLNLLLEGRQGAMGGGRSPLNGAEMRFSATEPLIV